MRCTRSFISLLVVSVIIGCASKRAPLPAPLATLDRTIYSGSALSGPTTRPVTTAAANETLIVSIELRALDAVPAILNPVAPDVRLIVASQGDGALQPRTRLTRGVRWQVGAETPQLKERSVAILNDQIAIPAGACAVFSAIDQNDADRALRIGMTQPSAIAPDIDFAFTIVGKLPAEEGSGSQGPIEETAVLKPVPISEPTKIAVLLPFAFSKSDVRAVLALIDARRASDSPEDAKLLAASSSELKRTIATAGASPPTTLASQWTGYEVALRGLEDPKTRRASLLFLCRQSHAAICQDLALTASDQTLETIAGIILQRADDPSVPRDDASLAWLLDSGALRFAADLQTKDQCPPELLTLLIRHAGQVGMNSGSVAEILNNEKTRAGFETRVISENVIYLEDSSPAARVRAYDWLAARGKGPANYDPLGPPKDRAAALEKLYESLSEQASRNGGRP